ncbi:MAG: PAS domain S-box protein [Chloroflexi bacterium]|nr:PAS domain S-box protein [Chloroflexota bacterium]
MKANQEAKERRLEESKVGEMKLLKSPLKNKAELLRLVGELQAQQLELETQLKEQNQARAESDAVLHQYHDLMENSQDLICAHDLQGNLVFVNPAGTQLSGYSHETLLKMNLREILAQDVRHKFGEYLTQVQAEGQARGVLKIQTAGGDIRYLEYNNTLQMEGAAAPIVHAIARDVTARKLAEDAHRRAEIRYRSLFDQSHDGVFILDLQGRHMAANQRAADMLGYTLDEVQTLSFLDVSAETPQSNQTLGKLLGGENIPPYERIFRRRDGGLITVDINVELVRDANGRPLHILSVVRDINERKQAEDALKKSEQKFRGLADNIPIAVYQCRNDSRYTFFYLNTSIEDITGYPKEEFLENGLSFFDLYHPDDLPRIPVPQGEGDATINRKAFHLTYRIRHKSGEWRWVDEWGTGMLNASDEVEYLEGIMVDITERKQMEEALRHSSDFLLALSGASHTVQQARTAEEVYRAVGEQIKSLGFIATVLTFDKNGKQLSINYTTFAENIIRSGEKLTGLSLQSYRLPISNESAYGRIIAGGRAEFVHWTGDLIAEALPKALRPLAGLLRRILKINQGIIAPLQADETSLGLLTIGGSGLSREDVPSVEAFASQVAISLRNVRLMQELENELTERKQAEEALQEAEIKYRLLVERLPVIIYTSELGVNGRWPYVSPQIEQLLGFTPQEWMADSTLWYRHVHPEDRDQQELLEEQAYARGEPCVGEYRMFTRDGRQIWIRDSAQILLSQSGGVPIVQGVLMDITERKRAEEALTASEAELRALFASMQDVVLVIDHQGVYREIAPTNPDLLYKPPEELLGRNLREVFPAEQAEVFIGMIQQVLETRQTAHVEYKLDVGERSLWFETFISPMGAENTLWVARDVTQRKKAEEQLHLQSAALEAAANSIVITNREGVIEWANPSYTMLTGFDLSEAIGKNSRLLTRSGVQDRSFYQNLWDTILSGRVWHGELVNRRKDGSLYIEEMTITPLLNPQGEIEHFIAVKQDITSRKQAEDDLRLAEEKYRVIFENSLEGIFQSRPAGQFITVNPALARMWGYDSPEDLLASVTDIAHQVYFNPETRAEHMQVLKQQGGNLTGFEYQARRKDGSVIWVSESVRSALSADGSLEYYEGTVEDISARKQAEEQLRLSQITYEGILNSVTEAVYIQDENGVFLDVNLSSERLYGYSRDEFIGHTPQFLSAPGKNDLAAVVESVRKAYEGEPQQFEFWGLRKDGSIFPKDVSLTPGTYFGKKVIIAVARDVTERKQSEEALRLSEANLNRAQSVAHVGSWNLDVPLNILTWSAETYRIFGVHHETPFTYESFLSYVHPDDVGLVDRAWQAALQGILPYDVEHRILVNGEVKWVREQAELEADANGGILRGIGTVQDITERKRAEDALQESERRYRILFEDSPVAIWEDDFSDAKKYLDGLKQQGVTDFKTYFTTHPEVAVKCIQMIKILDVNSAALQMYKAASKQDLINSTIQNLSQGELEHSHQDLIAIAEGRNNNSWDGAEVTLTGEPVEISLSWLVVPGHEHDFSRVIVTTVDITRLKQAEELLRGYTSELERRVQERTAELIHANRAKDEFLANMSHELRTPLNSVLGFSESLLEGIRGPMDTKQQQAVEMIHASGQHLLGLINDVLDVSKIEAGKFELQLENLPVDEICRSSLNFIRQLANRKSITVEYSSSPAAAIHADPKRLKQILVNLLHNAVKFTPDEGSVTLDVQADAAQGLMRFSITDTGIGISTEDQQKLFKPFVQVDSSLSRQYEGTGLGLTLVKKLVEMHGGSVELQSEPGKGSCFTFVLPWNQKEQAQDNPPLPDAVMDGIPKINAAPTIRGKVLLVEDNEANIMVTLDYLENAGYQVFLASDGGDVLSKAELVLPNIILMDIQMPNVNGFEATRRLRSDPRFVSVPIIATTAFAMPGDRERCLAAGMDEYLSKPIKLKELKQMIERFLDKPPV